jgi:DNA-binding CsgD family transcriptional regulator
MLSAMSTAYRLTSGDGHAGIVLVERESQLASFRSMVDDVVGGQGGVALIEGTAGVGKSRLLAEAASHAEGRGAVVLRARGAEFEVEFPFGVVRQLFETTVAEPELEQWAFAGAAAPARPVLAAAGDEVSDDAGGASFAVLHGLFWLTLNLAADRPLVLALDDLHWSDRSSLRFVAYLARRLEGLAILVIGAVRSGEPGTDRALLADVRHGSGAVSLRLEPLSAAGSRELVRARLGAGAEDSFCAACHSATGGNPLLLRQLVTALEADGVVPEAANAELVGDVGPRAISGTVGLRLARLPADAGVVARAVSVLGDGAPLAVVAKLAQLGERRVAEMSAALGRAEILRLQPPLGFVHPLVRDAVYQELAHGEREVLHADAARLLAETAAEPDQVAAQLLMAPPRGEEWVAAMLQRAGRSAMVRGAPESAVAYLRRALEEPPPEHERAELLLELGLTETLTSGPAALEHLRQAYQALEDPARRAEAAHNLGRLWMFTDTPERGAEIAREAAAALPPELADARGKLEAVQRMGVYFGAGELESAAVLAQYRGGIDADGEGARMLEAMTAYDWMLKAGPAEACSELALRSLAGGDLIDGGDAFFVVAAQVVLVNADREEAMLHWEEVRAAAHRKGSLFSALGLHLWLGWTLMVRGDLDEAERLIRQAVEENASWGIVEGPGAAYAFGILAQARVARGDLGGAEQALDQWPVVTTTTDGENRVRRARVELALARGETEKAVTAAEDYAHHASYVLNPAHAPWRSLKAVALDRVGRTEEAMALAEDELESARRFGAPGAVGRALRTLGTLRRKEGLEHLEEAVRVLAGSPAKHEHAKALAALGGLLRRERKPTEAREPLRRALELADRCGAAKLAEHARFELNATGARPRRTALRGVGSLTTSELRVAKMAAEGLTNREIAQALYVTPKAVQWHLRNSYRKLSISGRDELAGPLAEAR